MLSLRHAGVLDVGLESTQYVTRRNFRRHLRGMLTWQSASGRRLEWRICGRRVQIHPFARVAVNLLLRPPCTMTTSIVLRSGLTPKCLARDRVKGTRKNSLGTASPTRTTFLPRNLIHELARMFTPASRVCHINNSYLEEERSGSPYEKLLERGVAFLSFFDVPFMPRILLHEFVMSSRLDDCAAERSSRLQEAGWHALRTTAHCGNATLPDSYQGWLENLGMTQRSKTASLGYASDHRELLTCQIRPVAASQADSGSSAWRHQGQAFKVMLVQGFWRRLAVAPLNG